MTIREWPTPVIEYIRTNASQISRADMAREVSQRFGIPCKLSTIKNAYRIHGIKGRTTRFEPGHDASQYNFKNTGHKHPNAIKARFKAGHKPANIAQIGDERIIDGYVQVKMTDTGYPPKDWVFKHRLIWEAANGPMPPKHILRFIDGNRSNLNLSNLLLVSKAENCVMNRWLKLNDLPEGGLVTVHLLAKIKIKETALKKKKSET